MCDECAWRVMEEVHSVYVESSHRQASALITTSCSDRHSRHAPPAGTPDTRLSSSSTCRSTATSALPYSNQQSSQQHVGGTVWPAQDACRCGCRGTRVRSCLAGAHSADCVWSPPTVVPHQAGSATTCPLFW
jgi:hypothetical protein